MADIGKGTLAKCDGGVVSGGVLAWLCGDSAAGLKGRRGWATLTVRCPRGGIRIRRGMYIDASDLILDRAYAWERQRAQELFMTQPLGGGGTAQYTWERTLDESRRMAAYLQSFGFPPGSRIGLLTKNCAHFVMSELAIWMAGYVSVALYPTLQASTVQYILEHSESRLLFVGKLDDWESMKPGVADDLPCISYPLSPPNTYPTWEDIIRTTQPKVCK